MGLNFFFWHFLTKEPQNMFKSKEFLRVSPWFHLYLFYHIREIFIYMLPILGWIYYIWDLRFESSFWNFCLFLTTALKDMLHSSEFCQDKVLLKRNKIYRSLVFRCIGTYFAASGKGADAKIPAMNYLHKRFQAKLIINSILL